VTWLDIALNSILNCIDLPTLSQAKTLLLSGIMSKNNAVGQGIKVVLGVTAIPLLNISVLQSNTHTCIIHLIFNEKQKYKSYLHHMVL